jgi:hypothetical protein
MAQDWNIRPRSNLCSACEKTFENMEAYYSALVFGEEGYQRGDFCVACWVGKEAELQPYSSWKGTFIVPPEVPDNDPLKKETAESLLRRLIEDENDHNAPVIYILAVMLERKKTLIEKDVKIDEDGTVHRVYEHKESGEVFLILDPQLKLDKLQEVQIQVSEMLGVRDRKTKDGGQRSEVGGQRSEVGGQRSEVGGQTSEAEGPDSEDGEPTPS